MKEYYGNYLGICINNDDPQKRGRVQIFIPHIMPALYEYWNKEGIDIKISCVGDNVEGGLPSDVIEELRKILPWAESASPILGSSSPGVLTTATLQAVAAAATGGLTTLASKAIDAGKKLIFNQSPVAQPVLANQSTQELGSNASKFGPLSPSQLNSVGQYSHKCGQGARQILGAMTNNPYFSQGLSAGSGGSPNAGSLSQGNDYLQKSGLYQQPVSVPANYTPQKGDVITGTKAGGPGHIQVYDGSVWRSDTIQPNGFLANYGDLTLHRMNDNGLATVGASSQQNSSGNTVPQEQQSQSGTVAAANPLQSETPIGTDPDSPDYGNIADPDVYDELSSSASSSSTSTTSTNSLNVDALPTGLKPYAQDFISAGQKYNIDPNFLAAISWNETGGGTSKAFKQGNNAMGISNASGPIYGFGSVGESIDRQARTLANPKGPYAGATTIGQIGNIYSPVGAANDFYGTNSSWIPTVGKFYNKLTGKDPNSSVLSSDGKPLPPASYPSSTQNAPKVVNKTDPHGPTAVVDINNMAKGVFSYPAPGALLWVFFQEGNPLFPVYFAANYGPNEWQSAYRYGSPGPGYKPEGTTDDPSTSTGGIMNLNGVGGLRWENTDSPNDPTQSQKSIALFGEDGSNMFIGTGYHQIFSKFDRRDQVEGDRFQTTLGYKEEWVQGDDSKTVMGDVIVRIGNVSQPAVDAVTRIQELIKDSMKPVTEPSN